MPRRSFTRAQTWLLPPIEDLVCDDHPARFAAAFVDGLDAEAWEELGIDLEGEALGAGSYHPRQIWIYGFMRGVRSSRKLCREQVCLWLAGCSDPTTTLCGDSTTHTGIGRYCVAPCAGDRRLGPSGSGRDSSCC